ncbi:Hypothetical protein ORPV_698 [Orpheovirus IHUMI-LCC2]|uniref:Uncharacterized protein n=1 Tax=Orpheovirus IHUMI-LCC2 TaxID=2023057 RepID=A0A2I2L4X7_9VIRU|nr:Hypothetical protein ORPV_698 [Orpheovirus IHUMI-LCC2]SNW62602.1 Hypothetical protein ORPV_698 [Orpheovirus IHUMI-LCC2]
MDFGNTPSDLILEIMVKCHPYDVTNNISLINKHYNNVFNQSINISNVPVKKWRYFQILKTIGNFTQLFNICDSDYVYVYSLMYPDPNYIVSKNRNPFSVISNFYSYINRSLKLGYDDNILHKFIEKLRNYINDMDDYEDDTYEIERFSDINEHTDKLLYEYGRTCEAYPYTMHTLYTYYPSNFLYSIYNNKYYSKKEDEIIVQCPTIKILPDDDYLYLILLSPNPVASWNILKPYALKFEEYSIGYEASVDTIRSYVSDVVDIIMDNGYDVHHGGLYNIQIVIATYCLRDDYDLDLLSYLFDTYKSILNYVDETHSKLLNKFITHLCKKDIFTLYFGDNFDVNVFIEYGVSPDHIIWIVIPWISNNNNIKLIDEILNEISSKSLALFIALRSSDHSVFNYLMKLL